MISMRVINSNGGAMELACANTHGVDVIDVIEPSLQLDDNGDNTFTVTAENAKTDVVCFGQITLGENEGIQLEADFENSGELIVRFVPGEFEADSFPDEASELTIVGQGTESHC